MSNERKWIIIMGSACEIPWLKLDDFFNVVANPRFSSFESFAWCRLHAGGAHNACCEFPKPHGPRTFTLDYDESQLPIISSLGELD